VNQHSKIGIAKADVAAFQRFCCSRLIGNSRTTRVSIASLDLAEPINETVPRSF